MLVVEQVACTNSRDGPHANYPLIVMELDGLQRLLTVPQRTLRRYISRDPFNSTEKNEDVKSSRARSCDDTG